MFKGSIKKLNLYFIPLITLIISKLLGVFLGLSIFEIRFTPEQFLARFDEIHFLLSSNEIKSLNSVSDMVMFFILFFVCSLLLLKKLSSHEHNFFILNKQTIKFGLINTIKISFSVYGYLSGWLFALLVACFLILVNFVSGLTEVWVVVVALFTMITLNFSIFVDIRGELANSR